MPRTRPRGKAGCLADLPSMHLDIVYETLYHLDPFDLLRLSRTTKAFRELSKNRNSAHIWKSARENVPGLPPCPEYLSEIAYARLAFEKVCHSCLAAGTSTVFFEFLARYCPRCRDKLLMVWRSQDDHPLQESLRRAGLTISDDQISNILPICIQQGKRPKLLLERKAVECFKSKVEELSAANVLVDYANVQQTIVKKLHKDAERFFEYMDQNKISREEEIYSLKSKRRVGIMIRLSHEWQYEMTMLNDDAIGQFLALPEVNKTQQMTDKAWLSISPTINNFMAKQRHARLVREALAEISPILNALDIDLKGILGAMPDTRLLPQSQHTVHNITLE